MLKRFPAVALGAVAAVLCLAASSRGATPEPGAPAVPAVIVPFQAELAPHLQARKLPEALGVANRALAAASGDALAVAHARRLRALAIEVGGPAADRIRAWEDAAIAWEQVRYTPSVAEALVRGAIAAAESPADEARLVAQAIRACEAEIERPLASAAMLSLGGSTVLRQRRATLARRFFEAALQICERAAPGSPLVGRARYSVGLAASALADDPVARASFESALELLVPGSLDAADAAANLGNLLRRQGELGAARTRLEQALVIYERQAAERPADRTALLDVARATTNIGAVEQERGDLAAARQHFERSLGLHQRVGQETLELAALWNNLAGVAFADGDLALAESEYRRSLALHEKLASGTVLVAASYTNLGRVGTARGDFPTATDYYRLARELCTRLRPASLELAVVVHGIGVVEARRGQLEAAQRSLQEALALYDRVAPRHPNRALALFSLARVTAETKDFDRAAEFGRQALVLAWESAGGEEARKKGLVTLAVAGAQEALGEVERCRGDAATETGVAGFHYAAAKVHHQESLSTRRKLAPDTLPEALSLNHLGALALRTRNFKEARRLYEQSIAIYENERRRIDSVESRSLLLAGSNSPYPGFIAALAELHDAPALFSALERSRTRSLVELMTERRTGLSADAPPDLIRRQAELDRRRALGSTALLALGAGDTAGRERLRVDLATVVRQQREIEAEIRRASPRLGALAYPRPLDLRGARAALDPGTLLLAYHVGETGSYLVAVEDGASPAPPRLYRLQVPAARLAQQVAELRSAIVQEGAVLARGRKLYGQLLLPAQAQIRRARRLLICPDGPLHLLPFGALPLPKVKGGSEALFLGQEKPLHTIVSMSVYQEVRRERGRSFGDGPALVAYGDPVYGVGTPGALASLYSRLPPLPGTRREVESIARLFGARAQVRLGGGATEAALKADAPRARYLHLAAHGVLDGADALGSGLALSPGDTEDGLIQTWEIVEKLRLRADLVVLSACETGVGETTRNEGVIGLPRALLFAGARSVVLSLWSVPDDSTAALMSVLYRELRAGTSKDEALRRAMRETGRNPRWRQPLHWGAFALTGDWR